MKCFPEGVLRGGDVLARAADAAHHGQRTAPAAQQPRGRAPGPRAARGAGRGTAPRTPAPPHPRIRGPVRSSFCITTFIFSLLTDGRGPRSQEEAIIRKENRIS